MSGLSSVFVGQKHLVKFVGVEKVDHFHLLSRISLWASLTD